MRSQLGHTPLTVACLGGHLNVVTWLLENGSDVNEATNKQFCTLICASQKGHLEVVQCLVKNEANIEFKNCHGYYNINLILQFISD